MRDKFFDIKRRDSEQLLTRCVDHVESSCQMCVMCPHDPIACRLSRFDVLLSVFFTHRLLLYFRVRSWRCRDVTLVETESAANESCSQTAFFVLHELRFVFTSSCVACKVCNTWSN